MNARRTNDGEHARRDLADPVAKVEQSNGEAAEDDAANQWERCVSSPRGPVTRAQAVREVEPAEEGTLVGEENLGFLLGPSQRRSA